MGIKLTRKVTVEKEITGVIKDLVQFAISLQEITPNLHGWSTDELIDLAVAYWEREHGE